MLFVKYVTSIAHIACIRFTLLSYSENEARTNEIKKDKQREENNLDMA
jgi:hypothetical protein